MVLLGLGMGATFVSITIAATAGVPHHEAGLASGILNTSQQIGGAVGLAVLTGISTSAAKTYIDNLHMIPNQQDVASAMVHGFHMGYLVASTFGICASLVAFLLIKQINNPKDPSHSEPIVAI